MTTYGSLIHSIHPFSHTHPSLAQHPFPSDSTVQAIHVHSLRNPSFTPYSPPTHTRTHLWEKSSFLPPSSPGCRASTCLNRSKGRDREGVPVSRQHRGERLHTATHASVWGESVLLLLVVRMLCDSSMMTIPQGRAAMHLPAWGIFKKEGEEGGVERVRGGLEGGVGMRV